MMSKNIENKIFRFAKGSKTTKFFLDNIESILKLDADVYFLAIGCNDIRYRNPKTCAMTEVEYMENMEFISKSIINKHPLAQIICISPWESGVNDPFCKLSLQDKNELYKKYNLALESMCKNNGFVYVNPNLYINQEVSKRDRRYYMIDHIHCNADQGVKLYSEAVLKELATNNFFIK